MQEQMIKKEDALVEKPKDEGGMRQRLSELNRRIADKKEEVQILEDVLKDMTEKTGLFSEKEIQQEKDMVEALSTLKNELRPLEQERANLERGLISFDEQIELGVMRGDAEAIMMEDFKKALNKKRKE